MKLNTPKALIATLLATAFAGAAVTAIAQNASAPEDLRAQHMAQRGAPMDPAQRAEMQKSMQARMAERHTARMDRLKAELKLAPAQEAAWNAYVARTEPTPPKAPPAQQDWSELTTPQRMDAMQALHAERSADMSKRIEATKSFYAQLTAEQQKTFDARSGLQRAGMKGEHRMGGHGRHGGERHGMGGGMGCESGPMPGGMGGPGPRS